ncbi:MAG: hypothetical protein WAN86_12040 [Hyphomicrobiaceae bacterium]
MNKIVPISLCLAALLGGYGPASAQEKVDENKTQELKQVDPAAPPALGKSAPEKAGAQEPSTQGKGPIASTEVLVNGRLTAPGAATDGQAVPSKFSARNAALDKLPIVAFRLRDLADAEKRVIYGQLHAGPGGLALSPGYAMVGAQLPADIALRHLKPTPESLTAKFSGLRGTSYLIEGPNVLLVNANNNEVIGVLPAQ